MKSPATKKYSNVRKKITGFLQLMLLPGFLCLFHCLNAARFPAQTSNYIDSVDYYLKRADIFTQDAMSNITDKLRNLEQLPIEEQLENLASIGRRLEQIDIDAAMKVYNRAEKIAKDTDNIRYINKFQYRKGSVMPMMGLVREGIDVYMSVKPEQVDVRDKFDYFTTGRHVFDAAVDYYRVDSLRQKYKRMANVYNDSVLVYVQPGSVDEFYYAGLSKLSTSEKLGGVQDLIKVLHKVETDDPVFAKAAAEIASAYASTNDWAEAKYYLALSAIGDLKAGTREATSLHRLGKLLNNEEDYFRAYDYLTYSLESAVSSGSSLRTIEIGEIMPDVVKAERELERKHNRFMTIVIITLSLSVIVFVFMIIYAFQTRNRLNVARKQLVDINDSKDLYIKKLTSLCGAYLTALENFNLLAGRKIKVGQINDLLAMIESGKVIREQLQSFYEVFDDAFLSVYPDFVDRVNELLLPGKYLSLTDDGRLGTELRIVAFMRLGIDDSTQIAKFLGLSLNTIYTYRNKVKNRAKNRDSFDENVRNIGRGIYINTDL